MSFDFLAYGDDAAKMPSKTYDLCIVDADTILYQAAATVQTNFIIVTHKESGRQKRFKNVTEFYGRGKKIGGWLGEQNTLREQKDQPMLSKDDFEIEQFAEIDPDRFPTYQDALDYALTTIDFAVGELKRNCDSDDYVLVIGSSGNYRKDAAILKPYKGGRGDKPLVFSDLAEKFTNKYKRRVIIAENEEAEDVVAYMMQVEYVEKLKQKREWKKCFAFCDKDLLQIPGPCINYQRYSDGFKEYSPLERMKFLCAQVLAGDPTDFIGGLPNLSEGACALVGMRKTRGVNRDVALEYLDTAGTIKEVIGRTIFAWHDYYGDDPVDIVDKDGNPRKMMWHELMNETAILVYLRRKQGEMFDFYEFAKQQGVI